MPTVAQDFSHAGGAIAEHCRGGSIQRDVAAPAGFIGKLNVLARLFCSEDCAVNALDA